MKINELSKFALTLALLPWVPAFLFYKHGHEQVVTPLIITFLLLSLVCFSSKKFSRWFKSFLEKIGEFLGKYIAIFILAIGYIFAVLPTALIMKIVKRDRLLLKKSNVETYWKNSSSEKTDYEYQF